MFLQRTAVRNMVLATSKCVEELRFAMLWLVAYTFLLRVPSEVCARTVHGGRGRFHFFSCVQALPMCRGGGGLPVTAGQQSVIW